MEHLAIMRKSWKLTDKILNGSKTIESRWYKLKYKPWNSIRSGENVYFKDSGEPVTIKTEVEKVIQFANLTPQKVVQILKTYGSEDGIEENRIPEFYERFKDKKYCILIFLRDPQRIKPFEINKKGFGMMSAWITMKKIDDIKRN